VAAGASSHPPAAGPDPAVPQLRRGRGKKRHNMSKKKYISVSQTQYINLKGEERKADSPSSGWLNGSGTLVPTSGGGDLRGLEGGRSERVVGHVRWHGLRQRELKRD